MRRRISLIIGYSRPFISILLLASLGTAVSGLLQGPTAARGFFLGTAVSVILYAARAIHLLRVAHGKTSLRSRVAGSRLICYAIILGISCVSADISMPYVAIALLISPCLVIWQLMPPRTLDIV